MDPGHLEGIAEPAAAVPAVPVQPEQLVAAIQALQQQQQQLAAFVQAQQQQQQQQQQAQPMAAEVQQPAPVNLPAPGEPPAGPGHTKPLLKPVTPSSFSGGLDEDVVLWSWQVDQWLTAGRVQLEIEKVTLAAGLLRDAALAWWRTREQQPNPPHTWNTWREELRNNFEPINPVETYRDQLETFRQTTSVLAYATTFRNIVVNLPTMTDEEKRFKFIYGLKRRTREQVRLHNPATLEEAVRLAVRFDSVYSPGSRSSFVSHALRPGTPMELGTISSASGQQNKSQQARHPNGSRPQGQRNPGQRSNGLRNGRGAPRLDFKQRQQLIKEGKCFYCQKTGHLWRECPSRNQ